MDKIDAKIVRALQEDGRLTNQDLAEKVGLSPSPCLRRVRNLEKAGIIKGYCATIDQKEVPSAARQDPGLNTRLWRVATEI